MNTEFYNIWAEHLEKRPKETNEDFKETLKTIMDIADKEIADFEKKLEARKKFIKVAKKSYEELNNIAPVRIKNDLVKREIILNMIGHQLKLEEYQLSQSTKDFSKRIISTRIALLRDLYDDIKEIESVK